MTNPTPQQVAEEQRSARLETDLTALLNRHSAENDSNTPDYILASYLVACLRAFNESINRRSSWYGRFDAPGRLDEPTKAAP